MHVIHRPGLVRIGKELYPRSRVQPEAAGRGPYSRLRAQVFPIRTDPGRGEKDEKTNGTNNWESVGL